MLADLNVLTNTWRTILEQCPSPVIVLDARRLVLVASHRAADLLEVDSNALDGKHIHTVLGINPAQYRTDQRQDKIDTRIGGARVIFDVSEVHATDGKLQAIYLTIVKLWRFNVKVYECVQQSDFEARNSEEEWESLQYQMLEEIPATIVAVSTDGKHVYQNARAHATLGPIETCRTDDVAVWMREQYNGARSASGVLLKHTELPLYQAAVENRVSKTVEIQFGQYIYMLTGKPLYNRNGKHCGGMVYSHDVTKIKQEAKELEEKALQQSDIKFREITNCMEQVVWVAKDGAVSYLNMRWYEFTGATEEQSLGDAWYNYIHPDDVENTKNNWLLSAETDEDRFTTQHRLRAADGSYRWFLARAIAVRDLESGAIIHWLGTSTDITQISEALQEAKSAREQLFNIMSVAHVHYFVVTTSYLMSTVYLAGRPNGAGLYGQYKASQLRNQNAKSVLSGPILQKLEQVLSGVVSSAIDESEVAGVWWKTQIKVMKDDSGTIVGVVCTAMDINEEKIKDEQLAKASIDRFKSMQISQLKTDFLARMSHEIRTPIGGILGMVQLMKDSLLPEDGSPVFYNKAQEEESKQYLESIKRCGDNLLVIINDILDFSKIEVGKMDIEHHPFDLQLMANDVYVAARHGSHRRENVDFKLDYQIPQRLIFNGDANRIRQILMNLMSNALKFTELGHVICRVSLCDSEPLEPSSAQPQICRVKFEVVDTGIGITSNALEKLFNPFVQADSSTARKFGGSGLGLSIALQLVKLMSGALDLKSVPAPEVGHGSIATCIIPLEVSSEVSLRSMAPLPLLKFVGTPKVLLVEDNKINQVIAQKTLQKLGIATTLAENGQEALDYLLATTVDKLPDIILMDCQMPLLDGYEATAAIRKLVNSRIRNLPIVAMTASAITGDKEKCLAVGMNVSTPIACTQCVANWQGLCFETYQSCQIVTDITEISRQSLRGS